MPSHIRAILAMSYVEDLQELANLAGKVSEASQLLNYQVALASSGGILTNSDAISSPIDPFSALAEILTKQFEKLSTEIKQLKSTPRHEADQIEGHFGDRVGLAIKAIKDAVSSINVLARVLENAPNRAHGKHFQPRKTSHAYLNGDHRYRLLGFYASSHPEHIVRPSLFGRHRLGQVSVSRGY